MVMAIGISEAVQHRFEDLGFWLGVLAIVGGLLMVLGCEIGYRRGRAGHRGNLEPDLYRWKAAKL
jgi:hypothetical protein